MVKTPPFQCKGLPCGSAGKESACNAEDLGLIPGLRRSPGERKGYPLQYAGLENSMDCIVHGLAKRHYRATFTFISNAGGMGSIPGRETKVSHAMIVTD